MTSFNTLWLFRISVTASECLAILPTCDIAKILTESSE
uniref:Uncharacterized protein n=1 Tax=Anguilla anguilla TaxID=7936 RepID=A0A0E9VSD3_ANGAN